MDPIDRLTDRMNFLPSLQIDRCDQVPLFGPMEGLNQVAEMSVPFGQASNLKSMVNEVASKHQRLDSAPIPLCRNHKAYRIR